MILAALLLAGAAEAPRDWAATLRADARAFHDTIAANHPGPVNALDPGFSRRNDAALALATKRAGSVHDYAGYRWAMNAYEASFDDGHVAIGYNDRAPALVSRWPGFLTGYGEGGRPVVMTRADDAPVPLGAELIACDGVPAATLAATRLGAFRGRWTLTSQQAGLSGRLLLDSGNPFVPRLTTCRFRVDGATRDVRLMWRDLSPAEQAERLAATGARAHPPIGARTLADGTRWFTLSSFDNDVKGEAVAALVPMIAAMKADRTAIAAAPRVVLDLRGNNGGSSDWSRQVAAILWGQAAIDSLPDDGSSVDWRASAANLATIDGYRREWAGSDAISQNAKNWADDVSKGLTAARAGGRALWHEPDDAKVATAPAPPVPPLGGRVYVLTDRGCGSACLDAVDLWRALGAVQVGQETSADTLYMDVRQDPLPSGIATAYVPMKVYRGRKRGSNVPWVPVHRYTGDLRDTAAIERWIGTLG